MNVDSKIHTTFLNRAAKEYLAPLGLAQLGRSRFWRDDRGWFVIGVEFQPSSWSRGSYLNVGCNWLWNPASHFAYDTVDRIGSFVQFDDPQQFENAIAELAQRAADRVMRYRAFFEEGVQRVCEHYNQTQEDHLRSNLNRAIAHALTGSKQQANYFLTRVIESEEETAWAKEARSDAERLYALLENDNAFRSVINERVRQTRLLKRLPLLQALPFKVRNA